MGKKTKHKSLRVLHCILIPEGDYFLWLLTFYVFADWIKNVNFVPTNISHTCMHYRTLHYVDPVLSLSTDCKF